jgi:hypothetical protein
MYKNFTKKILVWFAIVAATSSLVTPFTASAASYDDDCPLGIVLSVTPAAVKSWAEPVTINANIQRNTSMGVTCSSKDDWNMGFYFSNGGAPILLSDSQFTFEANRSGSDSITRTATFDMSQRGVTTSSSLTFVAAAAVKRTTPLGVKNVEVASKVITVSKTADGKVPPGGGTGGGTGTGTGTNSNSNTSTGPQTVSNVNTSIGGSFANGLDSSQGNFFNPLEKDTLPELLAGVLRILFALIGTVAVIIIIIAGFKMVLANGNETELTNAKKAITWAVVGLIVALMSFSIVAIIQKLIQG